TKDVCTYTGQIADGVPNGTGTATFSNGADKDASYHLGYGVGTVVEKGVFVGGFLHGRGKVTCPKNGKKEGIFVNGKLDNGTTTFSHFGGRGESVGHYSGQIAGGAPNGAGTMTFDDSREKGTFVNGKLSGQGHKKFGIGWEDAGPPYRSRACGRVYVYDIKSYQTPYSTAMIENGSRLKPGAPYGRHARR
ncbi:hypothetical protein THAOC_02674, partial [Thalassiosira oceanica]